MGIFDSILDLGTGGIASGIGLLGSAFSSSPDFNKIDTKRYGFQGAYQNFLNSEKTKMKDDEQKRIMKLASGLVPGSASFRSGVSASGVGGPNSSVLANAQHQQQMAKALDTGTSAWEQSSNRLDSQFLEMSNQNEQRYFDATKFNATGEYDANKEQSNKWQGMFGQVATAGMGMLGEQYGYNSRKKKGYAEDWQQSLKYYNASGNPLDPNIPVIDNEEGTSWY